MEIPAALLCGASRDMVLRVLQTGAAAGSMGAPGMK